jgi:hypothetical protein
MLQRNSSVSVTCNEIWWKKCYFTKEFENMLDDLLAPVAPFLTIYFFLIKSSVFLCVKKIVAFYTSWKMMKIKDEYTIFE